MSSILCSLRKMSMKSINRGDGMDAPALALAVLVFFAGTTLYYASRYSPPANKPPKEWRIPLMLLLNRQPQRGGEAVRAQRVRVY